MELFYSMTAQFDHLYPNLNHHFEKNAETANKCAHALGLNGYTYSHIYQTGVTLSLLECHPPS